MAPIALSLLGSGLRLPTQLFFGWFGPRGLASILFALLVIDREGVTSGAFIFDVVVLTVAASIALHGLSATPLAKWYGGWAERTMDEGAVEHRQITPHGRSPI
jgi:NhaP-type Na+/H+ or K+/H+ antiporter